MRDLLRKLQVMRKDEGLEIEDRITMTYNTDSDVINNVFKEISWN